MLWTYVISDLKGEEIFGRFYEKELQKTCKKEFRAEKVIKKKGDKLYVRWKSYNSSFKSWMSEWVSIFQNQNLLGGRVKVDWDLSNYATKTDLKNPTVVDTSTFT